MKVTGQIICTRALKQDAPLCPESLVRPNEDWEVRCDWTGGRIAAVSSAILHESDGRYVQERGRDVYQVCHLRVRVIGMKCEVGTYTDTYLVMRDGLLARLAASTTKAVYSLSRRTIRLDRWLYRTAGRPLKAGTILPQRSLTGMLLRLWNPPNWQIG
jgi:hypothetical protein